MTYHGFLLDADNTLFDFDRAEQEAVLECMNQQDPAIVETFRSINTGLWRLVEKREMTFAALKVERFRLLAEKLSVSISPQTIAAEYLSRLSQKAYLFPGVVRVLDVLSRRSVLGLLTNGLSAVQRPRIARAEIGVFFQEIFVSEELSLSKPDPQLFHLAAAGLHVPPHQILCVGDSPTADIAGAQAAGMDCCWYNPHGIRWPGPGAKPDYVIGELESLIPFTPSPS